MFKIGAVSLLILFVLSLSAQNDIDNLKDKLRSAKSDTARLALTLTIAEQFQSTGSDSALFYLEDALALSDNLVENKKQTEKDIRELTFKKSQILKKIGVYYVSKYKYDSSLVYYSGSVKIVQNLADTEKDKSTKETYLDALANSILNTGIIYFEKSDPVQSAEYYNKAIDLSKEINDSLLLSKGILNLGMVLNDQGKYDEAINNYITAIKIFENLRDKKGIAICYLSIGNILRKQNTLEKAVANYSNALEMFRELNDERGECACYNNLGICYASLEDFEKGLEFYNQALAIHKKNGNKTGIAMMYSNISAMYQDQNDYDKAAEYILKSLEISEKNQITRSLVNSYINLASVYLLRVTDSAGVVPSRQEYLDKVVLYAGKGFTLADSLQLIIEKITASKSLKDAYSLKGNYKEALEMADIVIELNDSLYNKEKTEVIANVEAKYETGKKEHEIQRQKLELHEQQLKLSNARMLRNSLAAASVLMIIVVLLTYRNYRQKYKANQILDEKNNLIERQNREILLKSSDIQGTNKKLTDLLQFKERMTGMIVHDLKNPLSNILNSSVIPDQKLREQLIMQSGYDMLNLIENILDVYKLEETGMRIEKEPVDFLKVLKTNLAEVALYISEKRLSINLPLQGLPPVWADRKLIKRVFSNLLSNAVKYSPEHGVISVGFEIINGKDARITIHNQGPAIPKERQGHIFESFGQHESRTIGKTSSTGLGLSFCKMAIEAHQGEIGVISEEQGAEFWFFLPDCIIGPV